MDATIVSLDCWIRGDEPEKIFPVDISTTKTFGALQKAIKSEKSIRFRDVDPSDLVLYKISSSDDARLEGVLRSWNPSGQRKLNGRHKISSLSLDESEWLIIIDGPNLHPPTHIVAVPDMTLNCWLRGQQFDRIFPIRISSTEKTQCLRTVIKENKPIDLRDIDPDALTLYKVSIAPDQDHSFALGDLTLSSLGKPLATMEQLSNVLIPLPPSDHLHLIVVPDGLVPVQCWIRGSDNVGGFVAHVLMRGKLHHLCTAIVAAHKSLENVPPYNLRVYKIPNDDKLELSEVLGSLGWGECLYSHQELEKIFEDVPFSSMPSVVVETMDEKISKPPPTSYRHSATEDPITAARTAYVASAVTEKPSRTGAPSSFRKRQLDPSRQMAIPCGRPRDYEDTIPVTLLHPVFGEFLDDCQNINVTAADNLFVQRLGYAMSALYDNERERIRAVDEVFKDHGIHFTVSETKGTGYVIDGDINTNGHRYVVAEFKNETGNTSAEPYFQAIGYYLESTRETAVKFRRSTLPCLLVVIFGSYIVFAGAAWNLRPTVQLLSTPIAFHFHSTDIRNQIVVARHMVAFCKAATTLKGYYESLQDFPLPTSGPVSPHMFPHPTSYNLLCDGTKKHFQYLMEVVNKLVFFGIEDDEHICIKFTQSYSREAHECLARLGCAPALRGVDEIAGGWLMVVMDRIPDGFDTLSAHQTSVPPSVFTDIGDKLRSLHEAGYVHGDIRDTNTMISEKGEFMIIDFDWAGRIAETTYPACVNFSDIRRPANARDGEEISPGHDEFMLSEISERYSRR